jgi:lysozyme
MMSLGPKGRALIQSFESLRLQAYQDQRGIWSIAWGHTAGVVPYQTCSVSDADDWFTQDTQTAVNAVNRTTDVPLSQEQFDALSSFVFNVGAGAEAHSTLLSYVNQRDFAGAADQFLVWNHVNGVPNDGLTRRRQAERALFLSQS